MKATKKEEAVQVLTQDAEKIKNLIKNQQNYLCLSKCPAFEEVVDTQMYGFSREVAFAANLGLITEEEGHRILSDLEKQLSDLYNDQQEKN